MKAETSNIRAIVVLILPSIYDPKKIHFIRRVGNDILITLSPTQV
jgi:hypothetical protein